MRKIFAGAAAAIAALSLSGCISTNTYNAMENYDFVNMNTDFIQLREPREGDKIAVIDTEYGEIRAVLYEQYAPNTVADFIERAENGEFDNKPVYGVMPDVYFMTGGHENDKGAYTGRSSDDELIANEYTPDLWPFRGALVSFSEKSGFSDARWFICNTDKETLTEDAINQLKDSVSNREDEKERDNLITLFDKFYEIGGVFGLAGYQTVFGQTYEGLDVVERLCNIPSESDLRAKEDVMINSVTISEYGADETSEINETKE